jgi:hypothetical protein
VRQQVIGRLFRFFQKITPQSHNSKKATELSNEGAMKNILGMSLGMAAGTILYDVMFKQQGEIDFYRAIFIGLCFFVVLSVFYVMKKLID